jgi:DNA repair protein RadD
MACKPQSRHLEKWGVPHNHIKPNREESKAFKIHVVSKDTLIRRYNKIKNWPDLLVFDECHLYLDRQIEIISKMDEWLIKNGKNPSNHKILGFTATPERLDGRGLWKNAGGVYDILIEGPSIPWLMENDYLSQMRYFSPPIDGIGDLKRKGYDYDAIELDEFLKRKKIYGELVGHYEKHGKNKPALIFCRSVKSAYMTAERFREKGFNFYCIEGKMTDKRRRDLIQALTNGTIDGLTNCELATYGLDIPRIEYGASIRPTLSRSLYFQMIGRILRPYTNPETGYQKEEALFFDHVNLVLEHQEPDYPGVPPHYVPYINWNFKGREKRKIKKTESNIKLCPYLDFMYCEKPHCQSCRHNPDKSKSDCRRDMVIIPADLIEKSKPIPIKDRPYEEQREIQDKIGSAVVDYKNTENPNAIAILLDLAKRLGYKNAWKWVYYKLTSEDRYTRNIPVLHEIARQEGYHPWWVKHALKALGDKQRRG